MDAKVAAARVKSGLNNISLRELLDLHQSLKDNSEFASEFASINDYAKNNIVAFGNSTSAISLEDALAYQAIIDALGKNKKGELNEEFKIAQAKLDTFTADNYEMNVVIDSAKEDNEAQDIEYNLFDVNEADFKSNMSFWDEAFDEASLDNNDKTKLKEFNAILGRVQVKDDELGLDSSTYLDRLIAASMLESKLYNLGSPQVAQLKQQEKNKKVFDDFINIALTKISALSIAQSIRPAQGKECDPRTSEYKAYIQEYNAKVKHNIANIINGKSTPIVVSSQGVITACAETSSKADEFVNRLSEKFKSISDVKKIQNNVNKFEEGCEAAWKNRWNITKAIVESVRKNKWQAGLGLAGSLAVTGVSLATAAPVAIPVTLGYMAYSTATSWVAPILDEAAGLRKDAKAANQKMGFLQSLKQAQKNKSNDASYKRKAAIGTGFAVLGGGLIGASYGEIFSAASDGVASATSAVTSQVVSTVSRVSGSNMSLFVERYYAKKAYEQAPADKKEALRKNLSAANTALTIGLLAGTIATYVGMSKIAHASDAAAITNNALDQAGSNVDVAVVEPEVDISHFVDRFPSYNSGMGISHAQYTTLLSTRTAEDLTNMYNNLSPEVMENFPDLTKEELLYNYNRLDAFTKIVNARTGVSIDGAKRWHWDTEMTKLKAMIECGEKITVAEMAAAKFALSHIQENGDYIGPGDHVRTDYYLKTIHGKPCPEDNVSHYARGGGSKVRTPPVEVRTPPVEVRTPPVEVNPAPVVAPPVVAEPVSPEVTKYVPLTEKFNVRNEKEHWEFLKSRGAILGEDGKIYVPSTDGTGIEIEKVALPKGATNHPDGKFNVRNSQDVPNVNKAPPAATPVATPTAELSTRYVPLDKSYNVKTEAEIMKEFRGKGLILAEDGRYYVPSKDGTGVEIEKVALSGGKFNVQNAQELIQGKKGR